jgi:hypothetical protein
MTELAGPKFCVGLWRRRNLAALMPMPKAAVYEDDGTMFCEDDVRLSRQAAAMEPKPEPESVQRPPQRNLWLGIGGSNSRHAFGPLGRGKDIDHVS